MNEEIFALACEAIDQNVADSAARKLCKWVMGCELNGFETIHPSNSYLAQHFGWTDETTRVSLSKAKNSGFISIVGRGNKRTFELNVQFLKGKMAEIQAKKPLKKALDFSDVLPNNGNLPNILPNNLPNILPNNLPNILPNIEGQNNRGDSAPNSNSNMKENRNRDAAGSLPMIVYLRVNPSGKKNGWKSQKVYSIKEEVDRLDEMGEEDYIDFKHWKSPNFVGDDSRAKFKRMKVKLVQPDVVDEDEVVKEDGKKYKKIKGGVCY